MRFLLRPSGEDKFKIYSVGWPVTALMMSIPLLLEILMETSESYLSFREGIRLVSLTMP